MTVGGGGGRKETGQGGAALPARGSAGGAPAAPSTTPHATHAPPAPEPQLDNVLLKTDPTHELGWVCKVGTPPRRRGAATAGHPPAANPATRGRAARHP
jgi:hypothetical protein